MFWSKNKKKKVYPCKPQFYYIKVGCKGVFVTRTCFRDDLQIILFTAVKNCSILHGHVFVMIRKLYANMPMQYTAISGGCKNDDF